ncbi:gag-polypeptide of LTR copia-type domain-containing protein [Phthorimaea operculella]|nr:gag-polypeptide of LTR copia-type domain-containing protein [Phthorimaea operculella]
MPQETENGGSGTGNTGAHHYNITLDKLNGNNFVNWKFAMRMALTLEGLWDCVQVAEDATVDAARDTRALARICLSLEPTLYQYVRDATSACDAWKRLADTFEGKGLYRKVLLLRQLHRVEYGQFSSMPEYINGVMKIVHQLEDIGRKIDDEEVAEIMLSGLPQEFDILVSSLETACLTSKLSTELVRTRLLQEDDRRNDQMCKNGDTPAAYSVNSKKRNITCNYCKRPGHLYKRCFKRKREEGKKKTEDHTMFASAYSATTADEFIIDSGASSHMCSDKKLVEDVQKKKCVISVANGHKLDCEYIDAEIPTPVWSPLSDDYHTGDEDESPSSSSSLPAPSRQGGATDALTRLVRALYVLLETSNMAYSDDGTITNEIVVAFRRARSRSHPSGGVVSPFPIPPPPQVAGR